MTATSPAKAKVLAEPEVKSLAEGRLTEASFVHGNLLHLTLPGDERIEEGEQDLKRFALVGGKIGMFQWIEVVNDAGSMYRVMVCTRVFGGPGTGLRGLWLRDLVPPVFTEQSEEEIVATGDWRVQWGGAHRKWMVISPGGVVKFEFLNTESDARAVCGREALNPKAR